MKTIIALSVLAIIAILLIWQWRRIVVAASAIVLYARLAVSPQWNNRVFLGLCAISALLFFNAIYQGGGEPLGLRALRESFAPGPQSKIVEKYQATSHYYITGEEKTAKLPIKKQPTWIWWKAWLFSLLFTAGFIPLAFWDEVRDAWRYAMERAEQRRVVINLRPESAPTPETRQSQEHAHPPFEPLTWGQRFRERVIAGLSANTLMDFAEGVFKRVVTNRIMRRI